MVKSLIGSSIPQLPLRKENAAFDSALLSLMEQRNLGKLGNAIKLSIL